jgi:NADH-quinone oxidoreductase subunit A
MPHDYYPVLLALGVGIAVGIGMLGVSYLMAQRTGGRAKRTTYESGVPLMDRSHKRLSIAFFLVAIDFIVFDLEAAFLYPYALVMRSGGWPLFWAVMVFIGLILVGYAYVWKKGGLEVVVRRPSLLVENDG